MLFFSWFSFLVRVTFVVVHLICVSKGYVELLFSLSQRPYLFVTAKLLKICIWITKNKRKIKRSVRTLWNAIESIEIDSRLYNAIESFFLSTDCANWFMSKLKKFSQNHNDFQSHYHSIFIFYSKGISMHKHAKYWSTNQERTPSKNHSDICAPYSRRPKKKDERKCLTFRRKKNLFRFLCEVCLLLLKMSVVNLRCANING